MIQFNDLKTIFGDSYIKIKKENGQILVEFSRYEAQVPEEDLEKYISRKDTIEKDNTSIFKPGYFEQVIKIQSFSPMGWRRLFGRDSNSIEIKNSSDSSKIVISSISYDFIFKFINDREFFRVTRRPMIHNRDSDDIEFRDIFSRYKSIKIIVPEEHKFYNEKSELKNIAEAGLFNISYSKGIGINLSNSWDERTRRPIRRRRESLQFPKRIYNSDLLAYYQLALSSDSPILSYLSLYNVLEHFFLSTTEKELHKRLSDYLVTPDFSHNNSIKLRRLTSLVRKFDQKMGEQKMLRTVLEHYFMVDQIVDWVEKHETEKEEYFTVPQELLGDTYTLDLNSDQIYSSLAKRIYETRNALVHSKDGEMPKFIPFSGQEKVISNELPLLFFLAENIIIKDGTDY